MKPLKLMITALVMASLIPSAWAQVNPQPGCVITLQNDTLYGTIDYRTDQRNIRQCDFKQEGATAFVTYRPGDISGYRILSTNTCYQTMTATISGRDSTFFAEYLVSGSMNLYRLANFVKQDLYILQKAGDKPLVFFGEEGSIASTDKQERRSRILPLYDLLRDSSKATDKLWHSTINRRNMTEIVALYNNEVSGGTPTLLFGNASGKSALSDGIKRRRNFHFMVLGGISRQQYTANDGYNYMTGSDGMLKIPLEFTMSGIQPKLSLGVNYNLTRLASGLYVEAIASWAKVGISKDGVTYTYNKLASRTFDTELTGHNLHIELGPSFRFGKNWKVQPLVRAGIDYNRIYGEDFKAMSEGHNYKDNFLFYWNEWIYFPQFYFGYYAGIGAAYPLPVGTLLLYLDYNDTRTNIPIRSFDLRIGYEF